jgi:hypothetical protein
MLKKNIRNLVVPSSTNDNYYILTDRKILEFIFSYKGRKILGQGDGASALNRVGLDSLDMMSVVSIPNETTISKVAAMLEDIHTPGLVFKNNIVTPWDVVIKTRHSRYA